MISKPREWWNTLSSSHSLDITQSVNESARWWHVETHILYYTILYCTILYYAWPYNTVQYLARYLGLPTLYASFNPLTALLSLCISSATGLPGRQRGRRGQSLHQRVEGKNLYLAYLWLVLVYLHWSSLCSTLSLSPIQHLLFPLSHMHTLTFTSTFTLIRLLNIQGNKANDTLEVCARCILFRPTYALKHLEEPEGTLNRSI